ncbi:hypothetical protein V6V89_21375 [Micromonospora sp. CPCC 206061]
MDAADAVAGPPAMLEGLAARGFETRPLVVEAPAPSATAREWISLLHLGS